MPLYIYNLGLICDSPAYDVYSQHVVIAENETQARSLCPCADECEGRRSLIPYPHECVWQDPSKATCEKIGLAEDNQKAGVVICSFHAG